MLHVTAFFAAICAIMLVALSIHVVKQRNRAGKILFGQEDEALGRAIRAQGNFTEYAPMFLVLLAAAEINGAAHGWLFVLGVLFLTGRIAHAYSLIGAEPELLSSLPVKRALRFRIAGMIATFTTLLAASVTNLFLLL